MLRKRRNNVLYTCRKYTDMKGIILIITVLCFRSMFGTMDKKIVFGLFYPDRQMALQKASVLSKYASSQFEISPCGGTMDEGTKVMHGNFTDYYNGYIAPYTYARYKYGIRPGNGEDIIICYVSCYNEEDVKQRSIGFCWEGDSLTGVIDTYFDPPNLFTKTTGKTIMEAVSDSIPLLHVSEKYLIDKNMLESSSYIDYCYLTVTIPESGIRVVKVANSKVEFNANLKRSVSRRLKGKITVDEELLDHTFYETDTGCNMSQEIVLRDVSDHFVLVTFYYIDDRILYAEIDYLCTDKE